MYLLINLANFGGKIQMIQKQFVGSYIISKFDWNCTWGWRFRNYDFDAQRTTNMKKRVKQHYQAKITWSGILAYLLSSPLYYEIQKEINCVFIKFDLCFTLSFITFFSRCAKMHLNQFDFFFFISRAYFSWDRREVMGRLVHRNVLFIGSVNTSKSSNYSWIHPQNHTVWKLSKKSHFMTWFTQIHLTHLTSTFQS